MKWNDAFHECPMLQSGSNGKQIWISKIRGRAGWCCGTHVFGGCLFRIWTETQSILTNILVDFLSPFKYILGRYLDQFKKPFLPNPFQTSIHLLRCIAQVLTWTWEGRHSAARKYSYMHRRWASKGENTRGADKSLALKRKQQATGLKKMCLLYIVPLELHTLMTSLF
jgi:hypothetical protein